MNKEIELYNNTNFKLYIKKSNIKKAGKGLFTLEHIPKDTLIGYYEGIITKSSSNITDYSFEISSRYFIDASNYPRCYIAMINDAYNTTYKNNCEFRIVYYNNKNKPLHIKDRKIALYSITDINKNDELLASYGEDYWLTRSK